MARGEVGVYQAQEILSNVGFHIKGVWGVEPGYSSASSLLSGLKIKCGGKVSREFTHSNVVRQIENFLNLMRYGWQKLPQSIKLPRTVSMRPSVFSGLGHPLLLFTYSCNMHLLQT